MIVLSIVHSKLLKGNLHNPSCRASFHGSDRVAISSIEGHYPFQFLSKSRTRQTSQSHVYLRCEDSSCLSPILKMFQNRIVPRQVFICKESSDCRSCHWHKGSMSLGVTITQRYLNSITAKK